MILCLAAVLLQTNTPAPPERAIAIVHAMLIDGTGAAPVPDSVIVMRNGRIVDCGPRSRVAVPRDAIEIDATGQWALPGLIDLHVHLDEDISPSAYLLFGVTSVRDVGSRLVTIQKLNARSGRGDPLPRIFWMGRNIDQGSPSWWGAVAVKGPEGVPKLLDGMARQGVDGVKLYVRAGPAVSMSVIQGAKRRGWPVTGHVEETKPSQAARYGIDNLEHVSTLLGELRRKPSSSVKGYLRGFVNVPEVDLESSAAKELIESLSANRVAVTATLSVAKAPVDGEKLAIKAHSEWAALPAGWRSEWKRKYWSFISTDGWKGRDFEAARKAYRKLEKMVKKLHKGGVTIVAGTDTPAPWVLPGAGLIRELELLVKAGLTPMDAIEAATGKAGEVLRRSSDVGAIRPGRRADILLVGADPLRDIRNLRQTRGVFFGGTRMDMTALRRRFESAKR